MQPVTNHSGVFKVFNWIGLGNGNISIYENNEGTSCWCCGIAPNKMVMKYLHWSFRRSFLAVFLSAAVCFLFLTFLFAIPLYLISRRHPTCIGGPDSGSDSYDGHDSGGSFIDAYELSWTTFSTVGYGLVYSGISSTESDVRKCTGITIVVTLEAFVGMLFASMCGAILFAKVARIQSFAQVHFSDPIVVRYGSGVAVENSDDKDLISDDGSVDTAADPTRIPCPVLEFRINNRLNSTVGGEIIDASVNIVASIDASQAVASRGGNARRRRKKGKKGGRRTSSAVKRRPSIRNNDDTEQGSMSMESRNSSVDSLLNLPGVNQYQSLEEDPSGNLVPRRIFSKLEVETPEHPFFKRVWIVRHRLDETSPLLKPHARHMVRLCGGFWPTQLNSYEKVRESIHFDQILVSMSGTSNADANAVYAQKGYDFIDVCVGYRFVNQLYRDEGDGALRVDTSLISDVHEQAGGGGEPLDKVESIRPTDHMWVL
jgi:hypothetical protein